MTRDEARAKLVELTGIVPHSLSLAARIEAAIDAFEEAALRVVPPEGGPRAEPEFCSKIGQVLSVLESARAEGDWAAVREAEKSLYCLQREVYRNLSKPQQLALRASGAGTRQEEPSDEQCRKWALRQVEERGVGDGRKCGHTGFEDGCPQCCFEIGKRLGHVEAGAYYTHAEAMQSLGGEPPQ